MFTSAKEEADEKSTVFDFRQKAEKRDAARLLSPVYACGNVWRAYAPSGGSGDSSGDIAGAAVMMAAVAALVIFAMEFMIRNHWILYLVFTVLFIGAPLAGIHPGMESAVFCILFQISFWTVEAVSEKGKALYTSEDRGDASIDLGRKGRGIKKKCMIIVSVLLLAVIPLSVLGAALFGDELSSAVYEGEGFVSRSLQRISGNADETAASGHVSRGNNYRTGDPQTEVVLTREPTETLYLKCFSGGVYSDGEWEPADDEEIFLSVAVSLHWDAWRSWVASMFQNMYFVMNGLSVVQEISEPGVIYIIPYNGRSDITYIPYYSGWMNSWWGEQPGYGFQYFEQHEMNVRWNHVWQGYERMSQWYRQISLRRKAMKRKR